MKMLPRQIYVHIALILANSLFGLGSIVGTVGLSTMNPLCFTLVREVAAGILLLLVSLIFKSIKGRQVPQSFEETEPFLIATTIEEDNHDSSIKSGQGSYREEYEKNYSHLLPQNRKDWKTLILFGFFVSTDLGAYICGLHLAGPVVASIWQPSRTILTAVISMLMTLEETNKWRILGVLVAFGGCASMVLMNNNRGHDDDNNADDNMLKAHSRGMFLLGNFLFFSACLCDCLLVLSSKELLKVYPPLTVAAWCYILAAPFMLVAAVASSMIPSWLNFICTECQPWEDGSLWSIFSIPKDALPALLYYILAMSMSAWGLILWANQYVTGTFVVGYSVLQPIMSVVFVLLILISGWVPDCQELPVGNKGHMMCLEKPGMGALAGMLGILVGLALITQTEPMNEVQRNHLWDGLKVLSITTDFRENHNVIYGSIVSNGHENRLRP